MAAPTAFATDECSTCSTRPTPDSFSGIRKAPPPAAIRVMSSAWVFIRSTPSSSMAVIRVRTASIRLRGRWRSEERRVGKDVSVRVDVGGGRNIKKQHISRSKQKHKTKNQKK